MSQVGDYDYVNRSELEAAMSESGSHDSMEKKDGMKVEGNESGTPRGSGTPRFGGLSRFASVASLAGSVHDKQDGFVSRRGSVLSIVDQVEKSGCGGDYPESGIPREPGSSAQRVTDGGIPRGLVCYNCRQSGHYYRDCQNEPTPAVAARNRQRKQNTEAFLAAEARQKERIRQDRQREDERVEMRHREERLALAEARVREDRIREDGEKERLRMFRNSR